MKKQLLLLFIVAATGTSFAIRAMEPTVNAEMLEEELGQFKKDFTYLVKEYNEINKYYKNNPHMSKMYPNDLKDNLEPNINTLREKIYQRFITLPDSSKTDPTLKEFREQLNNLLSDVRALQRRVSP